MSAGIQDFGGETGVLNKATSTRPIFLDSNHESGQTSQSTIASEDPRKRSQSASRRELLGVPEIFLSRVLCLYPEGSLHKDSCLRAMSSSCVLFLISFCSA
jgi:hypothetical protein